MFRGCSSRFWIGISTELQLAACAECLFAGRAWAAPALWAYSQYMLKQMVTATAFLFTFVMRLLDCIPCLQASKQA